jgi:enoyl-CoA hydratase/carnithine racemase
VPQRDGTAYGSGLRRDDDGEERKVTQPQPINHHDRFGRVTLNRPDSLNRSEEFSERIRAFLEKRKPVYIQR